MLRIVLLAVGVLLALYLLYAGYFFVAQRTILFPRQVIPSAPPVFQATDAVDLGMTTAAGKVEAWLLPPRASANEPLSPLSPPYPLVIIAHGNAELIDQWIDAVAPLRRDGVAVLLVEYPGYGRSAGEPSQDALVAVYTQAYDAAVAHPAIDGARVLLFGRSVGGGVIAQLAARRPSAGMILMSTFTSVKDVASQQALPGRLARDPFDTLAVVRTYGQPLLILHGQQDTVIPFAHGQRLAAAAPQAELRPLTCGHNDCVDDWDAFWQSLAPFRQRVFDPEP